MKKYLHEVGKRNFDNRTVTITDPCYDKGTWCTAKTDELPAGDYVLLYFTKKCWYKGPSDVKRDYFERIAANAIVLDSAYDSFVNGECKKEYLNEIGVDAGQAGYYQDKPDYDDDAWYDFCEELRQNKHLFNVTKEGFCTESGWGDGCYPVSIIKKDGKPVGLTIDFLF